MAQAVRYRLSPNIRFNLKQYLDREFVNSGLFVNVPSGTFYRPGERMDTLSRVTGNLYESNFNNWLFETDASGVAGFPTIENSGVFIDGTFHAAGSSPFEPEIDYNGGRVFFNGTAVDTSSEVSASFTYKNVLVDDVRSEAVNLIFSKFKDSIDSTQNMLPSGTERQLPLVVIDLQKRLPNPHALGGAIAIDQLIVFHILSNSRHEEEQITDILTETSFRKVISAVNFNKVPLLFTDKGDRASSYKNYTELQGDNSLFLSKFFIDGAESKEKFERFGVYYSRVDWKVIVHERGAG